MGILLNEENVSTFIAEHIKITFPGNKYVLNSWGEVDKWVEIRKNVYVFIEVEKSQHHPNTNVLKIWPYLEENPNVKIFLIQTFFQNSGNVKSNRGRLAEWIAKKIEESFPDRFKYCRLVIDGVSDTKELQNILKKMNLFAN